MVKKLSTKRRKVRQTLMNHLNCLDVVRIIEKYAEPLIHSKRVTLKGTVSADGEVSYQLPQEGWIDTSNTYLEIPIWAKSYRWVNSKG